jgi:hypothetical protein
VLVANDGVLPRDRDRRNLIGKQSASRGCRASLLAAQSERILIGS